MTYQQFEKEVFDWLWAKHEADDEFRFSVRKSRSKGAENDYFIGTEKSGYFATSFWFVPVSYPGASIDPISLVFKLNTKGEFTYLWELHMGMNIDDRQSELCLELLRASADRLESNEAFSDRFKRRKSSKAFTIHVNGNQSSYGSVEQLMKEAELDMPEFIKAIDDSIVEIKSNDSSFEAHKLTKADFDKAIKKLHQRVSQDTEEPTKKNLVEQESNNGRKNPLNQILFGPPGTGKTYNTIDMAVEIVDGDKGTHEQNKVRYDELVKEKQIQFVTFHQSMSYEDFVEGIKPVIEDGADAEKKEFLEYEVAPGIFKRICQNARTVRATKKKVDWDNPKYFKMSLGGKSRPDIHEWCIENGVIGLGWGGEDDLSQFKGEMEWEKYRDKFKKVHPELVEESRFNIQSTYAFINSMRIGDVVVASMGNHIIDAIGVIKGEYYYDDGEQIDYFHFRQVDWIVTDMGSSPEKFFEKKISQMAIYEFDKSDIKYESFKSITASEKEDAGTKPYVLIIDEINRGNVSQIFGELITLLEEDKREGEDNAITVKLPYSKKDFSVPANLHILGTMNTADRSVEALDSALRRRFSFKEMPPRPELLSPGACFCRLLWKYSEVDWEDERYSIPESSMWKLFGGSNELWEKRISLWDKMKDEGEPSDDQWDYFPVEEFSNVNLQVVLETLNERIEKLIDRDHLIGHSYFINVVSLEDLRLAFKDKVIPLLQEYFYGNYERLRMVLGDGFIKRNSDPVQFAVSDVEDDFESRPVYSLANAALTENDSFFDALKLLLPKFETETTPVELNDEEA